MILIHIPTVISIYVKRIKLLGLPASSTGLDNLCQAWSISGSERGPGADARGAETCPQLWSLPMARSFCGPMGQRLWIFALVQVGNLSNFGN